MHIIHLALGGCLKAPPVAYGLTEDTGGHITYVLGAAMAQARHSGAKITIVTRGFDAPDLGNAYSQEREAVAPGCTIRRLFTANRSYLEKDALWAELPALRTAFLELLDLLPPADAIHAHFSDAVILADAARSRFGMPVLYSPHSLGQDKVAAGGTIALDRIATERWAINTASAIISSSRDEAECQIAGYDPTAAGRVHRVPPGISLPEANGTAAAETLLAPFLRAPHKPLILAIARPVEKKNLNALITAYAGSSTLRANANLAVVAGLRNGVECCGDEQRRVIRELFDTVDRCDLWGQVALPRRHDAHHVPELYNLAAQSGGVFVNPALHEPFGLTLVEAARYGLPVVATRNGGPADVIDAIGHGRLIDPHDVDGIAQACNDLMQTEAHRAATAAARSGWRQFSWESWASRISGIIRDLRNPAPIKRTPRRILASDIDGTLTGCRIGADAFTSWANKRSGETGFVVATGRSITEARRVIAEWHLPVPDLWITSTGSEIWVWNGSGKLMPCPDWEAHLTGWPRQEIIETLRNTNLRWQADVEQRRWKVGLLGDQNDAATAHEALCGAGLPSKIIPSHGRFVDILPEKAGKACAVDFVAQAHNLSLKDCIAAGDSGNDVDMLEAAGGAIIPANGFAEIAHLTANERRLRTRSSYAAGVLEGLERFGLTGTNQIAAE